MLGVNEAKKRSETRTIPLEDSGRREARECLRWQHAIKVIEVDMNDSTGQLVAESAKKETDAWNRILELRINLQKPLELANRLPVSPLQGDGLSEVEEGAIDLRKTMGMALDEFIGVLEMQSSAKKRKRGTMEDSSLEEHWDRMQATHDALRPKWVKTIDKWHARLHFGSESSKKKLTVFDKGVFDSVRNSMLDEDRNLDKSRSLFVDSRRMGKHADLNSDEDEPKHDLEVYDDRAFYSVLLKTFISNSAGSSGSESMRGEDIAMLRKYRQSRANVDRKASKGRKLRYVVHPKLLNFAFPVPKAAPEVDVDRLFSSLFRADT